jgi:hypothetical protein
MENTSVYVEETVYRKNPVLNGDHSHTNLFS